MPMNDVFGMSSLITSRLLIVCKTLKKKLKTLGNSQYLVWWALADKWPEHQRMCESMARLVCRASRLKGDDPRNKGAGHSSSVCCRCELGITENAMHVIMQCPAGEKARCEMLKEIEESSDAFRVKSNEDPGDVFH